MFMPLNVSVNLNGYDVDCFRHNHSTWMVMPLNIFNLGGYSLRLNHSTWMVMPYNIFGIIIELE
jgi:hypothetical protein